MFPQEDRNFSADKLCGTQNCPVYIKNGLAIFPCDLKIRLKRQLLLPILVLSSIQKDCVPTTQKSLVIYEFSCRCAASYVGRTSQRLGDRVKQHVPSNTRHHNFRQREQPSRNSRQQPTLKHDSAIGQQLLDHPGYCTKKFQKATEFTGVMVL